jgi:hypothetical protein
MSVIGHHYHDNDKGDDVETIRSLRVIVNENGGALL